MKLLRKVKIEDTIYVVIEQAGEEVCVLQTFEYADGLKKQSKIWTKQYESIKE